MERITTKEYLVTLSSGAPSWKTSKWIVAAEDKSSALNYALLLHDDKYGWTVAMVTLSYRGANPQADESLYEYANPERIEVLNRIREHSKEKLEDC